MRGYLAAALALAFSVALAGQASAEPLPVPHNFPAGFLAEAQNPGGSLEGSNDWSCKPTAEHPRPVVLTHGTFLNKQAAWSTYVPLLKNEGYCVFAITYGATPNVPWPLSDIGGVRPIEESAQEIGDFVGEVLAATGARQVDILGHSQGTFAPNYYVKFLGGQDKVANYVSLAPLWKGSDGAGSGPLGQVPPELLNEICGACSQMGTDSPMVAKMNEGGTPYVPGVVYTNIMTRYDDTVTPYTAGYVEGPQTTNIVVQDQCELDMSKHGALGSSPVAAGHVLNALDPEHPRPVPCMAVSAGNGSPTG